MLDPRFHDVTHRVAEARREIEAVRQVGSETNSLSREVSDRLGDATAVQIESLSLLGQEVRLVGDEVQTVRHDASELFERLRREVRELTLDEHQRFLHHELDRLTAGACAGDLSRPVADLLNYANSHRGFAAQVGLWVNPPVVLDHREGAVAVGAVNERIAEVPYAFAQLAGLNQGDRVLDFGSSESQVSLSLASLGFQVTALDMSPHAFEHPNLFGVQCPLEDWDGKPGSFKAAVAISAIEHVGLGWYGEVPGRFDDRGALTRLCELVEPEGRVIVTLPYGLASTDEVQRRYDGPRLDELLEGFDVVDRRIVVRVDEKTWLPSDESADEAVALLTLKGSAAP